jgi:hypothetical protein
MRRPLFALRFNDFGIRRKRFQLARRISLYRQFEMSPCTTSLPLATKHPIRSAITASSSSALSDEKRSSRETRAMTIATLCLPLRRCRRQNQFIEFLGSHNQDAERWS